MLLLVLRLFGSAVLAGALSSCGSGVDAPDRLVASSVQGAPLTVGKFQNNCLDFQPKGLGTLLKWRFEAARDGLPKPPQRATPPAAPDLGFIRANAIAGGAMAPAVT